MQTLTIILLGLAMLAYASTRSPVKTKPSRFQHLKGWQKIFGVLAVIMTLLIVINPEFLVLGLLGDMAFFDMLVLVISLQLQVYVVRVWRSVCTMLSRTLRWLVTPSVGTYYLLAVSAIAIGSVVSAIQKAVHRIFS